MKFLVDNQLPPALASWLIGKGHEAEHVFALGLAEATDGAIWDLAIERGAVVVTKDSDFAERRMARANGPVVLWLRIGNVTTSVLLTRMGAAWLTIEAEITAGQSIVEVR